MSQNRTRSNYGFETNCGGRTTEDWIRIRVNEEILFNVVKELLAANKRTENFKEPETQSLARNDGEHPAVGKSISVLIERKIFILARMQENTPIGK